MANNTITVIWDLDGTLLDTYEWHFQTWNQVLSKRENQFNRTVFERFFGSTNENSVKHFLGYDPDPAEFEHLVRTKEALFCEGLTQHTRLFPGVLAWLEFISSSGMKQAIASSAQMENINRSVDGFGIRHFFTSLISGADLPSKPAPDVFLEAARQCSSAPAQCVVMEDSYHGLQAARAAGMLCVGKRGTFNLQPGDADFILDDYLHDPRDFFQRVASLLAQRQQIQSLI